MPQKYVRDRNEKLILLIFQHQCTYFNLLHMCAYFNRAINTLMMDRLCLDPLPNWSAEELQFLSPQNHALVYILIWFFLRINCNINTSDRPY